MAIDLIQFWGKAGYGPLELAHVHPAAHHMLDVGRVATALVRQAPRTGLRGAALGPAEAVGFLAALHDLGKLSPGFQNKRQELTAVQREAGLPFPGTTEGAHAATTAAQLGDWLGRDGSALAAALGAHHGHYAPPVPLVRQHGQGGWITGRAAARDALASLLAVDADEVLRVNLDIRAQVVLMGLTAVCDWLGSDATWFPPTGQPAPSLAAYAAASSGQAEQALAASGWSLRPPASASPDFDALFGFRPNALQRAAMALEPRLNEPCCVVIEAPMGLGKTEAALYLADRLINRLGHVGCYFALPTQATSGQMFRRVCERYLANRLGEGERTQVHLLHGQAAFDEAYEHLADRPAGAPHPEAVGDEPEQQVLAAQWFRGRKRGLLSPYAVGTIDQALFGVLHCPHFFVRLYGLADKVVIFDEVHAYDTYTSGLLDRLLTWLGCLGSSVIILSATLPASRRDELLAAYGGASAGKAVGYPRITAATARPVAACHVPVDAVRPVTVTAARGGAAAMLDELATRLAGGGCACWIPNTVAEAQASFLAAREHPGLADAELRLLHASFPVARRLELTRLVEGWSERQGLRPGKALLIATQVVEQSLDLDFDLLATDLAPIDLVLQRSGRLHRHQRSRPAGLDAATLLWADPGRAAFGKSEYVYEPWLLLRSWLVLQELQTITDTADLERLVELVYGEPGPPVPEALAKLEADCRAKYQAEREKQRIWAAQNVIGRPEDDHPFQGLVRLPDDEEADEVGHQALTRLGRPSATVVCAQASDDGVVQLAAGPPIPLDRPPTRDEERRLAGASVRVSRKGWVAALSRAEPPEAWAKSAVARNWRVLRFDGGWAEVCGLRAWLDGELGLVTATEVLERLDGGH